MICPKGKQLAWVVKLKKALADLRQSILTVSSVVVSPDTDWRGDADTSILTWSNRRGSSAFNHLQGRILVSPDTLTLVYTSSGLNPFFSPSLYKHKNTDNRVQTLNMVYIHGKWQVNRVTCSYKVNQLQPLLLHQSLSPVVQVLRGRLFGFDWQGRDPPNRRGRAKLYRQRCRLWTSQVTHLTHGSRRVVQISAELTHPLEGDTQKKRKRHTSHKPKHHLQNMWWSILVTFKLLKKSKLGMWLMGM